MNELIEIDLIERQTKWKYETKTTIDKRNGHRETQQMLHRTTFIKIENTSRNHKKSLQEV